MSSKDPWYLLFCTIAYGKCEKESNDYEKVAKKFQGITKFGFVNYAKGKEITDFFGITANSVVIYFYPDKPGTHGSPNYVGT